MNCVADLTSDVTCSQCGSSNELKATASVIGHGQRPDGWPLWSYIHIP